MNCLVLATGSRQRWPRNATAVPPRAAVVDEPDFLALTPCMDRPCVARGDFEKGVGSRINVSGLVVEPQCSGP